MAVWFLCQPACIEVEGDEVMGWIAFWTTAVLINLASLVNHILKDTTPWFSVAGLMFAVAGLTYNVVKVWNE